MAAEERAKIEFTNLLGNIKRKYEIMDVKWSEQKLFEIKFRTQIPRDSEDFNALCDQWVDLFSEVTNTVWVKKISNTGPKIRFRKQYQCWTQGGKVVQKELLFDARRCKGTLDMKVLTDNPFTRRKNKHIRLGLNVVVKVNFIHLHYVDTTKPFAFFVHPCEPLPEAPKPVILPNDRLPQLVAEMVQKGLNASPKVVNPNHQKTLPNNALIINNNDIEETSESSDHQQQHQDNQQTLPSLQPCSTATLEIIPEISSTITTIAASASDSDLNDQQDTFHANLLTDLQDKSLTVMSTVQQPILQHEGIQLPSLQQHQTIQLVQNVPLHGMDTIKLELPPHLQQYTQVVVSDMSEPLLMCQSLMFDTSQVIPVSAHTLPSHFVQIHSQNFSNQ